MQFSTRILAADDFTAWVTKTQSAPDHLDFTRFLKLAQPTINEGAKPAYFSNADPKLFLKVYQAVQNGAVFPVPMNTEMKTPGPAPVTNSVKTAP
jgi:cytochrome o ubiquinol oxidase subunit 2